MAIPTAMAAPFYKLDNLTAIVDRNRIQNDRFTSHVMELEPLADRWRAFGWRVLEIDGHDFEQVLKALTDARTAKGQPAVIIAHTVKGKGIEFMEDDTGIRLRDIIGVDNMLWGNDFPHSESTWPKSMEFLDRVFADAPDEERWKITSWNAAHLFKFQP